MGTKCGNMTTDLGIYRDAVSTANTLIIMKKENHVVKQQICTDANSAASRSKFLHFKSVLTILALCLCMIMGGEVWGQTTLLSENFDNMNSISTSYSANGWYAYKAGNGNNWTLNTSSYYANSGSNSATYQYNSSYSANCYLVSAPFAVSANMTSLSVSLYEKVASSSYTETLEVFFVKASDFSNADGVVSATHYNAIASTGYTNDDEFIQISGSNTNSALASQNVRVVVHCTSAADMYNLYIDDITVTETTSGGGGGCPSITFSDLYSSNTNVNGTSITIASGISVIFNKAEGNTNPQYNTNGSAIRAYAKNTFTVTSSAGNITSINLSFGTGGNNNTITASSGTYDNGSWTGSATSVTFTIGGTNGNRRIAGIEVCVSAPSVTCPVYLVWERVNSSSNWKGSVTYSYTDGNGVVQSGTETSNGNTTINVKTGTTITLTATRTGNGTYRITAKKDDASGEQIAQASQAGSNGTNTDTQTVDCSAAPTTYTVTYDRNGGTGNVPTDANSPYNSGSTVTVLGNIGSPALSKTGYVFGGWNTQADGNGTTYAAGDNFTINANTTLYALWLSSYTVTWSIDGSTTTQNYPIAGSYALALPSAVATAAASHDCYGRVFVGWTANPSWSSDNPPADLFRIPTGNVSANTTYYAVFAYESGVAPTWSRVESPSLLAVGDKVVIAAKDYDFAMSLTQNANNRGKAEITKSSSTITWTSSVCEFDLRAGTTSGTWAFYDATNTGYIYAASSSNNHLKTQDVNDANGSWVISISSGTATITAQGTNSRKVMQYNNGNGIFACYASASQSPISIYRYTQTYIGYTTNCTPCTEPALALPAASGSVSVDATVNLVLTNPNNTDVTWTSSNPLVATVSGTNTGVAITGVNVGSATITANIPAAHVGGTYYCPASVTYDVTVSCNPYTVPVCFDFDGFASPTDEINIDAGLPSCWKRLYSDSGHTPVADYNSNYAPHIYNGTFAMDGNGIVITSGDDYDDWYYEYDYFGYSNYVVMPYVEGLQENDVVSFNAWWENASSGTLLFGYMTNPNDASTFTSIGTATPSYYYGGSSYTGRNEFTIPAAMPSGAYLAFRWDYYNSSKNYYTVVIDNVCIDNACTPRDGEFLFTRTSESLIIGNVLDISSYLTNTVDPSGTVQWTSSNTAVATVVNGVVTAGTEEGIAYITASIPKATISGTYYCDVEAIFTVVVSDGCVTIGSGLSTTGYAPLYGYYKKSYSQMIYTASEVGGIGTINKISFHSSVDNSIERTVKVYIGMTDKSEFTSDSDFIPVALLTQIWGGGTGGAWNIADGWNEFELTTPFDYYDETKNIVVAVYSTAADYESSYFYYTGKGNHATITAYSDSQDPAPGIANWEGYSGNKFRNYFSPNIKFCLSTENVLHIDYVASTSTCTGVVTTVVPSTYAFRGRAVNVSSREPVCSNGVFLGWCTTENGAVVYNAGDAIVGGLTGNMTLYAKYRKCDYVDVLRADSDPNKGQGVGDGTFDADGILKFNVCMGDDLTLLASPKPRVGDVGVPAGVNLDYKWYVNSHDGEEHLPSSSNPYTFEVNNVLGYAMGQDVLLVVEADDGCQEEIPLRVWVSKGLEVTGSANLDDLCVGDAKRIHVGADVTEHSIEVPNDDVSVSASMGESAKTFIPDGPDCLTKCYTSTVTFSDFKDNTRVTSVDNINYIRINMEHSFVGDIQIKIICPDGQEAIILQDYYSNDPSYSTEIYYDDEAIDPYTYEWPDYDEGYNRVYFGEPDMYDVLDGPGDACDENDPYNLSGVGYNYAWSSSSQYPTVGYVYDLVNLSEPSSRYNNGTLQSRNYYHVMESNVEAKTQIYKPLQSFDNLIGCHLNGNWTISVCDSWEEDNGYIFNWEISLEDIDNNEWEYEVTAVNSQIGTCAGFSQGLVSEIDGTADFNVNPTQANIGTVAQALGLATIVDHPLNCEITIVDNIGCHSNPYGFQYTVVQPTVPEIAIPAICIGEETTVTADLTTGAVAGPGSSFTWWRTKDGNKTLIDSETGITTSSLSILPTTTDSIYSAEIYDAAGCGGIIDGVVTINVPDDVTDVADYNYIWHGKYINATSTDWNTPSNWILYNSGTSTYSVSSANVPTIGDNVYIGSAKCGRTNPSLTAESFANDLTIASAATLTIPAEKTLNIAGDLTNTGTMTANNTSTVVFKGSNDQTISNAQGFGNVTFNQQAAGHTINATNGITVNNKATFTQGVLKGNAEFASTATVNDPDNMTYNSFVDGTVTRTTSAAGEFTFPTGSGSVLGTVKASLPASSTIGATFYHSSGTGFDMPDADLCADNSPRLDHVSSHEYWKINTSSSLSSATLKVSSSNPGDHFTIPGATTYEGSHIYGTILQGGCWKTISSTPSEVNDDHNTITISGVNIPAVTTRAAEPQPMSIGSTARSTLLPIELTALTATCDGRKALVEWTTASERNNDYFSLEHSDDAINFTEIARIAGAGNSIVPLNYSYTDYGVHGGDNYYRLVQVDYDGTRTASEIVVANCIEASGEPEVLAYPNPFGGDLTVELENFGDRPARIDVYDMLGRLVYTEEVGAPQNNYQTVLHFGNLPDATYTVRVGTADFVINRKVVKQQ